MDLRAERRGMLREFFPLLAAVALQQILALTVNLVDNFMLGTYSERAMSGAALVNQIQFMLQQLTSGIGAGVSVLGAQYWGKRQTEPIKKIIGIGLKFGLGAGLVFLLLTRFFPYQILGLLTDDAAILAEKITGYVFVVQGGKNQTQDVKYALETLEQMNGRVVGLVLNDVSGRSEQKYSYRSRTYGYYKGYYKRNYTTDYSSNK